MVRLVMTHQGCVDAASCLFATVILLQPPDWLPGIYELDAVFCYTCYGQAIHHLTVFVSGKAQNIIHYKDKMIR